MRQRIELSGSGVSPEEVAAALGVTPERQAAIREILGLRSQERTLQNGSNHELAMRKAGKKKTTPRK